MPRKLKNFVADFVKFSFSGFQEGFCSITNPRLLLLEYPTACPVLLVFFSFLCAFGGEASSSFSSL